MKLSIALLFLGAMVSAGCSAAEPELLVFSGLKDAYQLGASVPFRISAADKPVSFSCSVEYRLDGAWREISASVFDTDPLKAARLVQLGKQESAPLVWNSGSTRGGRKPAGEYRFRANVYGGEGREPSAIVYSAPFELRPAKPTASEN